VRSVGVKIWDFEGGFGGIVLAIWILECGVTRGSVEDSLWRVYKNMSRCRSRVRGCFGWWSMKDLGEVRGVGVVRVKPGACCGERSMVLGIWVWDSGETEARFSA